MGCGLDLVLLLVLLLGILLLLRLCLLLLKLLSEPPLSLALPLDPLAFGWERVCFLAGGWTAAAVHAGGWTAGSWTAAAGYAGRHGRGVVGRIAVAAGGRVIMGHKLRQCHPGVHRRKVRSRSPAIVVGCCGWEMGGGPFRPEARHGVGTWGRRRRWRLLLAGVVPPLGPVWVCFPRWVHFRGGMAGWMGSW